MNHLDIAMQGVGWMGMGLVLYGFSKKGRTERQILMGVGALLLAIMAAIPRMQPVFFSIELAIAAVGFINVRDGLKKTKLVIITLGALAGSFFALREGFGVDTWPCPPVAWLGIFGLTGVAIAYGEKPEKEGGRQSLWFGIGGLGMIGYSLFGVLGGVWQAWPFLILNIPFAYWGLRDGLSKD